ncbi:MAG: 6,7-dimethyl-8-ribityllumazine synthase [Candidatus Subteraquimicrobiales bacterium]|nr:6,7-dimethyl-8-ribityllumazine synthase [Candidatus Subteraquimicrobiales bacterium]
MRTHEGKLIAKGLRFGIVVSRFNEFFSAKLLEGALDALKRHDAADADIEIAWTPGSFEIPLVAKKLADTKKYDDIICLGVIIRGGTPHFDYVCSEAAKGIAKVGLETGIPVAFGVVTADTLDQAIERSGSKSGNKGWQAAVSAIEMANLIKTLS